MQQSRREFVDELLDMMGELGDADARQSAEILLNRVLQTVWIKHPWTDHRMPDPHTFTTVANQRTYVLPDYFGRVASGEGHIRNVTQGVRIDVINQDDLEHVYPQAGTPMETAGLPTHYFIGGTQGVHTQPAEAGEALEVLSSSAADTTVLVSVEGLNAAGLYTVVRVTLLGLTPVAAGIFTKVINFAKAYPEYQPPPTEGTSSAGLVTLRTVGAQTELEVLQSLESAHERLTLTLFRKPDAAYLFAVPVIRAPQRLIYDSDELPRWWGPALMEEARIEWAYNQGTIGLDSLTVAPRPRLKELIEHDNSVRYAGKRLTPFHL